MEQPHPAPPVADRDAGLAQEAALDRAQAGAGLAREPRDRRVVAGIAGDQLGEPAGPRVARG